MSYSEWDFIVFCIPLNIVPFSNFFRKRTDNSDAKLWVVLILTKKMNYCIMIVDRKLFVPFFTAAKYTAIERFSGVTHMDCMKCT